jgi:hypothetical protein
MEAQGRRERNYVRFGGSGYFLKIPPFCFFLDVCEQNLKIIVRKKFEFLFFSVAIFCSLLRPPGKF